FGVGDMDDVEKRLIGTQHNRTAISEALSDIDIAKFFGGVTTEEFLQLIY
ncbi:MAG: lipoate protein ligase C-terminal domain-containing protein, partial [Lysinibacillus sp.]